MKKNYYDNILRQVALKENTTLDKVKEGIEEAIDYAYKNTNSRTYKNFVKLFGNKRPTIEEFLDLTLQTMESRNMN